MGLLRRHNKAGDETADSDMVAQLAQAEAQRLEREARQAYNRSVVKPVFADTSRYPAAARARVVWASAES